MSSIFTRKLTFRSYDLEKNVSLVLTFDDEATPGIFKDVFPTAFRVLLFGKTGPGGGGYHKLIEYKSQLGFTKTEINGGTVQPASPHIPINVGQKTALQLEGQPEVYTFTPPEVIKPPTNQLMAENDTKTKQSIGVGFYDKPGGTKYEPTQIFVFPDVGTKSFVQIEFTPILRGYITSNYQENAVLRGQISTHPLFVKNLVQLEDETNWMIKYDRNSGAYEIVPDDKAPGASANDAPYGDDD